jgi:hypothetical protein
MRGLLCLLLLNFPCKTIAWAALLSGTDMLSLIFQRVISRPLYEVVVHQKAWENHSRCIPDDCPVALLNCAGSVKGPVLVNLGNSLTYLKFSDGMAITMIFGFGGIAGRCNPTSTQGTGVHKPQFCEAGLV